jgi:S-DNA-T family DNA segregation ATPase FtsK/SpoIIIE
VNESDLSPAGTPSLATLLVASGPGVGQRYDLPAGRWTIGRGSEADVVLADPEASRVHACLVVDLYGVIVEDLGSKNGVTVDGVRVVTPLEATDGATLQLGATSLRVRHEGSRLARALAAGGEVTKTTRRAREAARAQALDEGTPGPSSRPLWPLVLVAIVLIGLVVALQAW